MRILRYKKNDIEATFIRASQRIQDDIEINLANGMPEHMSKWNHENLPKEVAELYDQPQFRKYLKLDRYCRIKVVDSDDGNLSVTEIANVFLKIHCFESVGNTGITLYANDLSDTLKNNFLLHQKIYDDNRVFQRLFSSQFWHRMRTYQQLNKWLPGFLAFAEIDDLSNGRITRSKAPPVEYDLTSTYESFARIRMLHNAKPQSSTS